MISPKWYSPSLFAPACAPSIISFLLDRHTSYVLHVIELAMVIMTAVEMIVNNKVVTIIMAITIVATSHM